MTSTAVRDAAANLGQRLQDPWIADRDAASTVPDMEELLRKRGPQQEAQLALAAAREHLVTAIRAELRLETSPATEPEHRGSG